MSDLYNLPLKVLWAWNCNEEEISIVFSLKPEGAEYQVTNPDHKAFNEAGELKIFILDSTERIYFVDPNSKVFIKDGKNLKRIWEYWKNQDGEKSFENTLLQSQPKPQESSPVIQQLTRTEGEISLSSKQIHDIVFELEFLLTIHKDIKGEITSEQLNRLIAASTDGFSKDSVEKITTKLKSKL